MRIEGPRGFIPGLDFRRKKATPAAPSDAAATPAATAGEAAAAVPDSEPELSAIAKTLALFGARISPAEILAALRGERFLAVGSIVDIRV